MQRLREITEVESLSPVEVGFLQHVIQTLFKKVNKNDDDPIPKFI